MRLGGKGRLKTLQTVLGAVDNWFAKRILRQKTADARRKPQQGWTPCEDLQRGRCCFMAQNPLRKPNVNSP
ncbi:hypothetical protein HMPREF9120_01362 [Neisseria sp. oral taxon 020 str. F0370]|nr:hypothetical protein HMPREF9120_01362 [Neisseria sp. oral taxon 020 str. F0370]